MKRSDWMTIRKMLIGGLVTIVLGVIILGYQPVLVEWSGFGAGQTVITTETKGSQGDITEITETITPREAKHLWDWLSVLGAPLILASLGYYFQTFLERSKEAQEKLDKERDADQQREEALQNYLSQLSELLVDKKLKQLILEKKLEQTISGQIINTDAKQSSIATDPAIDPAAALEVIKARTLSLLRLFNDDMARKASVLSFLGDAGILTELNLDLTSSHWEGAFLRKAHLEGVSLKRAKLPGADLSYGKLNFASLKSAILADTKLKGANFRDADLSDADFSDADLRGADLSRAILLRTDLRIRSTESRRLGKELTEEQLKERREGLENALRGRDGKAPPLICNVALPEGVNIAPDRDCDLLPQVLQERYPNEFKTLEEAKAYVDEERQKEWN